MYLDQLQTTPSLLLNHIRVVINLPEGGSELGKVRFGTG